MSSKKTKILIYAGVRIMSKGALAHMFVHGKEEYFWSKSDYGIIGNRYEAIEKRGTLTMDRNLIAVNKGPGNFSEEKLKEWEIDSKISEQRQRNKRAATRAKNLDNQIWPHVKPLCDIYSRLSSFEERDAFRDYVYRLIRVGKKS